MTAVPGFPDFRSAAFLAQHIANTMAFYHPHCLDPAGGCFHFYRNDGEIYNRSDRHLVSSARFVFDYAMYFRHFGGQAYLDGTRHCIDYLRSVHRNPATDGYAWTLHDGKVTDANQHCYGIAFVLVAYSHALRAGLAEAATWMDETWDLLERYFWDADAGLYRDEADAAWHFSDYRGQNANMHMCEAMLAAFEASQRPRYLDRAITLADHMTRRQAAQAGGLVWEHYDRDWNIDWEYHKDKPKDLFQPWGFQPGHQTEWAKLLLIIEQHHSADWLLPTAQRLFDTALERAWDKQYGGICYGFAPDGSICDDDKYHWVQAESLACAALLATRTGDPKYWDWYRRLWEYAWT
ncbi:MAG TPA: AGE family epimerase/isomerase, partial [Rhodanobacteraceae bacterium]|nr:AGE family epimerase/isomerase [Rhodanobacteraceae bacterium]